jgi:quinol-cytochrome oxidoreductase complex cytochrome b subunit
MDNYPNEVIKTLNILQRIRLSVFPGIRDSKHKEKNRPIIFRGFLLHFRPATVPERTLRFSLTWGLGVTAAVLLFILFGTGLMLKFAYIASPEKAYDSIVYLNQQIPFGRLIRNLHRWSANGLLLVVFLHFLRIFYTSAFSPPRQFNWIIGLSLFAVVILSNFTGYLLPWDQLAYWAITISTSMLDYIPIIGSGLREWILGGSEPGSRTLMNFYAIHTAILPALLLFFVPFHFWRIRKANGLVIPRSPEEELPVNNTMVPTAPHLIVRDISLTLVVVACVLLIAMFFDAPLADPANPGLSPNPTKAPWYFMGIQELLMHFHPVFALLVIPALLVTGLLLIPYFKEDANTTGIWFGSRKGRKTAMIAVIFGAIVTVGAVLLDEFVFSTDMSGPANMIRNGLLPFGILLVIGLAFCVLLKRAFAATNSETIQVLFTLSVTAFVVLTMIGIWFRGPGMQLMWVTG